MACITGRAVSHLEHADDVLLLSTSPDGLMAHIESLKRWALHSFVTINVDKTWAVAAGATPPPGVFIHSGGQHIPLAPNAKYVGMNLTAENKRLFRNHYEVQAKRSRKALSQCFAVESLTGTLPVELALKVYKARVDSHLISGADVSPDAVGAHVEVLEDVQKHFLRRVMGLGSRSCVAPLFSETGIWPIRARRADMSVRYLEYCRSRPASSLVSFALTDSMALAEMGSASWFGDLKLALAHFDIALPGTAGLTEPSLANVRERIRQAVQRSLHADFASNEKLRLLRAGNSSGRLGRAGSALELRPYLLVKRKRHRLALTGLLLSNHGLAVEQLRYATRARAETVEEDRRCRFGCAQIEDEVHALFECNGCSGLQGAREDLAEEVKRLGIEADCSAAMGTAGFTGLIQYMIMDIDRASVLAAFAYTVMALFDATPLLRPST